ncbi:HAD family hydrolase [Paraburkholderia sabiae]|uniref:HAD family phosphatase n=1 Tax=Paraburkholderia sabiae TaxID=273251 RepID=A0ABU9QE39_9BURK|nr:HAD family phosphatase [Paraburkholderia sabiae]WJZ74725.1 HAD family phosphatase [Paraburkholderia sabiae]CAD6539722.1 6-phosphogluconate phosphatase [Paraburkholderia sabiae]CAG9198301.1 Phosphoglycolate phosphatase [Paraburkholderia sabiae]
MTETRHADRALICDCDGVLIDSEAIAAKVIVQELETRWPGLDIAPVVMPLLGLRTERVLQGAASALGMTLTPGDIDAIRMTVGASAIKAPMVSGIDAALAQISLKKACASNSDRGYVEAVLERTGLVKFFGNRLFCADSVEAPKPAPDVYLAAARAIGVNPEACLVIEDSVAGVTAATSAGMTVYGFIGGGHASDEQVDTLRQLGAQHVFDDMKLLPELVAQWLHRVTVT